MGLKENINKIHGQLSDIFESVEFEEKDDIKNGQYVQFGVTDGGKKVILNISKIQLEGNTFNWSYYSNPEVRDYLVERKSIVDGFCDDVKDIFEKNRFSSDYLQNFK